MEGEVRLDWGPPPHPVPDQSTPRGVMNGGVFDRFSCLYVELENGLHSLQWF